MYEEINECLCCGSSQINKFIDLGTQPLANNLIETVEEEYEEFPLVVNYCQECWHSQLSLAVNPEILFKNYNYVTGTSKTMNLYCSSLAEKIYTKLESKKDVKILDIASNDGTFLEKFKDYGWELYGVEPAENLKDISEQKGIKTYVKFFGKEDINFETKFDVITALNVFAHVSSPKQFLLECKKNLKQNGLIIIQTSQRDMVEKRQFDTVYHEHISFFSTMSMKTLCERIGLTLNHVDLPDIHGDSYTFYISNTKSVNSSVAKQMEKEAAAGRYSIKTYETYQSDIAELKNTVLKLMKDKSVTAYGAAAKGIVLLNYFGIKPKFVIDENPLKQGKYIPKLNVPIISLEKTVVKDEDNMLILAWNFYSEISKKIQSINQSCSKIRIFPEINIS